MSTLAFWQTSGTVRQSGALICKNMCVARAVHLDQIAAIHRSFLLTQADTVAGKDAAIGAVGYTVLILMAVRTV